MWLISIALLFFASQNNCANANEDNAEALVSWLKAEGGFFHPNLEIRREVPEDINSSYGVFAKEAISVGELLLETPHNTMISGEEVKKQMTLLDCDAVRSLAKEFELGSSSKYAPYVQFLFETQAPENIPSAWSDAGKDLLFRILGYKKPHPLPPDEAFEWISVDWHEDCNGSHDPIEEQAALLYMMHNIDDSMAPLHDLLGHRNGHWFNSDVAPGGKNEPLQVKATHPIKPGDQIHGSQNLCRDCGDRKNTYGTPEIFRDYGFIEKFPQRWYFPGHKVSFEIDEAYQSEKGTVEPVLKNWLRKSEPEDDDILALVERINKLKDDMETLMSERDPQIPENEWSLINEYTSALITAVSTVADFHEKQGCSEGKCHVLPGYTNLDSKVELFTEEEYTGATCDQDAVMSVLDIEPYEELETIKSHYQTFTFFWNKETRATCFDIENTVQICDDYRPHYHEMSVHYAARYLNNIKRVLFVGGGDSMLLYEALKYPSLEFVVGLEIDQKVVRYSFKHHGTQPYFENEKVQWWFGDASKSLLMLPRDYFASFDLVLVDLSETITANSVTEKLDILGALALLVKPDGIILKNEVYFKPFASMFKYSAMVHWYDNPIICSQVMSMGSNTVDFLNPTLKDHHVDTLLLRPLDEIDDPFQLYHDYSKNMTSQAICYESDSSDATTQTTSPGIILILEAENVGVNLANVGALKDALTGSLEEAGLTSVSTNVADSVGRKAFVTIVLREGYIVARTEPEHSYCAFDIHFWSSFHKQEDARKALISAVKGNRETSPSFRIIAGGMFGVSTWKDDKKRLGPEPTEGCGTSDDTLVHNAEQSSVTIVLGEIMELVDVPKKKVAILCGDDTATCESNSDALKEEHDIDSFVHLSCPMMKNFNEFSEGAKETLISCKSHLSQIIKKSLINGKFNALILDSTANKFITSVLLRLFKSVSDFGNDIHAVFEKDKAIILSAITDESEEWRKSFLKKFKEGTYHYDPAIYAEIALYGSTDDNFKILLVCEDEDFVNDLKSALPSLEKKSDLKSDVHVINGGQFKMQHNFKASHHFSPDDYDYSSALEQWKSQKPSGHQIIAQMESYAYPGFSKEQIHNAIKKALTTLSSPTKLPTDKEIKIEEFTGLGDGCLFTANWSEGIILVLWDGRTHADVNLFAYEGLESQVERFLIHFKGISRTRTVLFDEHPRGFGNVVSYQHDFVPGAFPHWAS